jgi:threonine/homoserine/homoserine lactone efflux protein
MMPTTATLFAFALVSAAVMVAPGPSNIFLMAHGARHGRRPALAAMLGIETAAAIRILLCATGLSALLASSPVAFTVLRWTGVAYLAYLGVRAMRTSDRTASTTGPGSSTARLRASAGRGLLVGLANPKMVVFFLAFFPQFVDPARGSETAQVLVLGTIFWIIGTIWDLGFVYVAAAAGGWLDRRSRTRRLQPRIEGTAYLGMAAAVALIGGPI